MSSGVPIWTMRPPSHDDDAVGEPDSLVEIVGDEQDGLPDDLLQPQEFVLQLVADQRVECGERLVEEPDVRVDGKRARNTDALLLAAGKLVGKCSMRSLRPTSSTICRARSSRLALLSPRTSSGSATFSSTVRCGSRAIVLEHHAHAMPAQLDQALGRRRQQVLVVDAHLAVGGLDQAADRAHERRLAAARQAHHGDQLTRPDFEGRAADGPEQIVLEELLVARRCVPPRKDRVGACAIDLPQVADQQLGFRLGLVHFRDPGGRRESRGIRVCGHLLYSPVPRMMSLARSAIMIVGALVLPLIRAGITEASATRNPSTPFTLRCASTTASASLPDPAGAHRVVDGLGVGADEVVDFPIRNDIALERQGGAAHPVEGVLLQHGAGHLHALRAGSAILRRRQVVGEDARMHAGIVACRPHRRRLTG